MGSVFLGILRKDQDIVKINETNLLIMSLRMSLSDWKTAMALVNPEGIPKYSQ